MIRKALRGIIISAKKSHLLLFIASIIWGFAFVAQRAGMEHVGPFIFNAIRFLLGSIVLIPFIYFSQNHSAKEHTSSIYPKSKLVTLSSLIAGFILFLGSTFQQVGIVYTTAGKAGFITGLYIIIVPILGLVFKMRSTAFVWIGAILATAGLYLLSVSEKITIGSGDLLVLISAFFWAAHVHIIGWISPRTNSFVLAFLQFMTCSILSFIISIFTEEFVLSKLFMATVPIFYAGVFSVGIAYTLQVIAQKKAKPAHTAIILSLEAVFAAIGGWLMLAETFSLRQVIGCFFMLGGMFISQIPWQFCNMGFDKIMRFNRKKSKP